MYFFFLKKKNFFSPIEVVEGWDEQVVWLTITEKEVKENYERDNEPDTANYYTKNQGYDDFELGEDSFCNIHP